MKESAESARVNLFGSLGAVSDTTPLAGALATVPSSPVDLLQTSGSTWGGWGASDAPARLDQLTTIPKSMEMAKPTSGARSAAVQAATAGITAHEAGAKGLADGATGVSVESAIQTLNREITHDTQAMDETGEESSRYVDQLHTGSHGSPSSQLSSAAAEVDGLTSAMDAQLARDVRRPGMVRRDELAEEDGGEAKHVRLTCQLCLSRLRLTDLVRPGSCPLQSRRIRTAHPECQLANGVTVNPRESWEFSTPIFWVGQQLCSNTFRVRGLGFIPPWRKPRGKLILPSVHSHSNASSRR